MGLHLTQFAPYILYFLGAIVVFICISKPEWGIFFLIPLFPLQTILDRIQDFPLGKDFNDIIIIAIIVGWVFRASFKKEKLMEYSSLNIPLIIMIFYTLFSLYYGFIYLGYPVIFDVHDIRIQTCKNYILLPIIYFIVFNNIKTKKHVRWLTFLMVFVIFFMSLQFFRSYRFTDKSFFRDDMRSSGTFSYLGPNEYAAFYSHYIFIILGLLLMVKSKLKKLFLLLISSLNLYCIIFSFSRGSYLAAYFVLALTGLIRRNIFIIIFVLIIFFSWHTLLPGSVVERINMTFNDYGELEASAEFRVIVWKQAMELISSNPLFGVGFNTFPYLGFFMGDSHNVFVKIMVEQGIIGMIITLSILFIAFIYGGKLYFKGTDDVFKGLGLGLMMCILSIIISNLFGDRWTYLPLAAYFWAFMGLVARANIITQNEIAAQDLDSKKNG